MQQTTPLGTSTSQYDAAGELVESVDADGRATVFQYNGIGQETEENWYSSTDTLVSPAETIAYTYNIAGLMQSASDDNTSVGSPATDAFTYDAEGRVTSESEQIPGLTPVVALSDQYTAGNRTQLAATIGATADFVNNYQYAFDPASNLYGQMSEVAQSGQTGGNSVAPKTVAFSYFADGQFDAIARYAGSVDPGNEVTTTAYGYDSAGETSSIGESQGGAMYNGYHYVYNAAGNVADSYCLANSVAATSDYATWSHAHSTYDATGQLTGTTYSNFTLQPANEAFQFDANGNLKTPGLPNDGVGSDNEVTSESTPVGSYGMEYDADGNETARWTQAAANAGLTAPAAGDTNISVYHWDNRNRLTEVDTFNSYAHYSANQPSQVVEYAYDAFNRWVGETVTTYATPGGAGTLALQREFAYDGSQIVMQFDGTGALTQRYLWGPGTDQFLAQESPQQPGTVDWAIADRLGTVRDIVVSSGGNLDWAVHNTYDSYGALMATQYDQVVDMLFGFCGRPVDAATGLSNNLNRWYDPSTQRWLSPDPSVPRPDANPYRYCGNAPTDGTDPTGLDRWVVSQWGHGFILVEVWDEKGTTVVGYAQLHFSIAGHSVDRCHPGQVTVYNSHPSNAAQDKALLGMYDELVKDEKASWWPGLYTPLLNNCWFDALSHATYGGEDWPNNGEVGVGPTNPSVPRALVCPRRQRTIDLVDLSNYRITFRWHKPKTFLSLSNDDMKCAPLDSGPGIKARDRWGRECRWPATSSLLLALLLEVFPTEADAIFLARRNGIIAVFVVKLCCLVAIFAPVFVGIALYGWRATVVECKWRASAAVLIVFVSLSLDCMYWLRILH